MIDTHGIKGLLVWVIMLLALLSSSTSLGGHIGLGGDEAVSRVLHTDYGVILPRDSELSPTDVFHQLREDPPELEAVGMSRESVWRLYPLDTFGDDARIRTYYLTGNNYFLGSMVVYLLNQDGEIIQQSAMGALDSETYERRPLDRYLMPLRLQGNEAYFLLVRKSSDTPLATRLRILPESQVNHYRETHSAWLWVSLALMVLATLYTALISLGHRGGTYLWLLGFHLQALVYFAILSGYGHLILPSGAVQVLSQSIMVLNFLFLFILYRFARSFLSTEGEADLAGRWSLASNWVPRGLLLLALLSFYLSDIYTIPIFFVSMIVVVVMVVRQALAAREGGYWPATLLLAAMVLLAGSGFIGTSAYVYLLPANAVTFNAYYVGTLLALGVLSFSVSSRVRYLEKRQKQLTQIDNTTGYPNHTYANETLPVVWHDLVARQGEAVLVMVKLDGMDNILSTLGPRAADSVTRQVLEQFTPVIKKQPWLYPLPDFPDHPICLISRDEAVFLVDPTDKTGFVASQLAHYKRVTVSYEGSPVYLRGCFAVYHCHEPDEPFEQCLRKVSSAIASSESSPAPVVQYTQDMDVRYLRSAWLGAELQQAISDDRLTYQIQPQIDLVSGRIVSGELLTRWTHPEAGTIAPMEFIPLAERTGIITQLTQRALHEAMTWLQRMESWSMTLSLNLSATDLEHPAILKRLEACVEDYGVSPGSLCLEITESAMMRNQEEGLATVAALKAMGFKIAVDDFGTGYCSLMYLSRIRPDEIKIDQSFVQGYGNSEIDRSIVHSVITLADSIQAMTVAEGVETVDQKQAIQQAGCARGQGFHWSRAVPFEDFARLVEQQNQK